MLTKFPRYTRIAERFGEDFNLAVWRIENHPPNSIIKHVLIHNSASAYAVRDLTSNRAKTADILRGTWPTTALLRITATAYGSLFLTRSSTSLVHMEEDRSM